MQYLLGRLTEPSSYAGMAGLLIFGTGDISTWINIAGTVASLLAVVLKEGSN